MTIVYECLEGRESASLEELVKCCETRGYKERFKAHTDIRKSILYHLKRMQEGTLGRTKHAQRPVVREVE
jgi:hypothetical protein